MVAILLALLSSSLLILSFPKFDLGFLAWIALVPLLVSLKDKSLKSAFGLSFLTGISFFMGLFYWINVVSGFELIDFLLLGGYLGAYYGLIGLFLSLVSNRTQLPYIFSAPSIWVSLEFLRSHAGFMSLPWGLIGHSQYLYPPVIQISSFVGVYGVSFLVIMVNASVTEVITYLNSKRGKETHGGGSPIFRHGMVTLLFLILATGYGFKVLSKPPDEGKITITVIQGNIPQDIRWDPQFQAQNLEKHIQLTKKATKGNKTSLVVWPEGSVPGPLSHYSGLSESISALAVEVNTFLLIGTSQRPKFGAKEIRKTKFFNSAFLISPQGKILGQYNKIRLLPFSEYLPLKDIFPWPSRWASAGGNFIPGTRWTLLNLDGVQFGVLICWENIFPELFRQFVIRGASLTINITNEAWFGETAAPYQFLSMSVFRAVENQISVVRSANTGISCFIDPMGRVIGKVSNQNRDIFVEGHMTKEIPLAQKRTFYTIYGDLFSYLVIAVTSVMIIFPLVKGLRPRSMR